MKYMKIIVAISIINFSLVGCSGRFFLSKSENPLLKEYALAQSNIKKGKFKKAMKQLEKLEKQYSFSPYSQQIKLDLIYTYYKALELTDAQAAISQFIKINPLHPNSDYILYMKGLVEMELDNKIMYEHFTFGLDTSQREPRYAKYACSTFTYLIRTYPNSQYAADAYKRLIFLKERLAKFELAIVKYYNRQGGYVAVINRVENMIKNYPNTHSTHKAILLMENAYRQLKLFKEAEQVAKIIAFNK